MLRFDLRARSAGDRVLLTADAASQIRDPQDQLGAAIARFIRALPDAGTAGATDVVRVRTRAEQIASDLRTLTAAEDDRYVHFAEVRGRSALLRAAHEEFVTIPAWREAQKPVPPMLPIAQVTDNKAPALAVMRVEPTVSAPAEIVLPDPTTVIASITPDIITDVGSVEDPVQKGAEAIPEKKAEAAPAPVTPKVRRAKRVRVMTAIRRQRAIARASRLAQLRIQQQQQQQYQNADPFRLFIAPSPNGN